MLLRIESCGPPVSTGPRGPAARAGGRVTGHPGGAAEVRAIRQRSSRSPPASGRPARRCGSRASATAGADPDGGTSAARPGRAVGAAAPDGRDGMLGQDRCSARRSGPRPTGAGEASPGPAPGPAASRRLCVPAGAGGPGTGTLRRPAGPRAPPPARSPPVAALAHAARRSPGASSSCSPSPVTTCPPWRRSAPPRWRSPSAASGSGPGSGSGWSSGWRSSCRCCPGPASTSAPSRGWRWRCSRRCYLALLGGATALTSRLRCWPVWTAALWVADEALRGRFALGGFPWGRLGFSQTDGPLLSLAAYGGVPLVSFAVALTGTLLAAACRGPAPAWRAPAGRGAARRAGGGRSRWRPCWPSRWSAPSPGCRCPGRRSPPAARRRPSRSSRATCPAPGWTSTPSAAPSSTTTCSGPSSWPQDVAAGEQPQPDLVIWPENSSDIDPYINADAARQIDRAAAGDRCADPGRRRGRGARARTSATPRSSGTPTTARGTPTSSVIRCRFGEYVPVPLLLPALQRRGRPGPRDFVGGRRGRRPGHRRRPPRRPDLLRGGLRRAGRATSSRAAPGCSSSRPTTPPSATPTRASSSWRMSRLRAVEHGRSVAVAATSGISAVVAPDGSVLRSSTPVHPGRLRGGDRAARLDDACAAARRRPGVGAARPSARRCWQPSARAVRAAAAGAEPR